MNYLGRNNITQRALTKAQTQLGVKSVAEFSVINYICFNLKHSQFLIPNWV